MSAQGVTQGAGKPLTATRLTAIVTPSGFAADAGIRPLGLGTLGIPGQALGIEALGIGDQPPSALQPGTVSEKQLQCVWCDPTEAMVL
jgi:hypothetical protein